MIIVAEFVALAVGEGNPAGIAISGSGMKEVDVKGAELVVADGKIIGRAKSGGRMFTGVDIAVADRETFVDGRKDGEVEFSARAFCVDICSALKAEGLGVVINALEEVGVNVLKVLD